MDHYETVIGIGSRRQRARLNLEESLFVLGSDKGIFVREQAARHRRQKAQVGPFFS
jgi:hypothetical protein